MLLERVYQPYATLVGLLHLLRSWLRQPQLGMQG